MDDPKTGRRLTRRVPLPGVTSAAQAQTELGRPMALRQERSLPVLRRAPKFGDQVSQYLACYQRVKDAKRPQTLKSERHHLNF